MTDVANCRALELMCLQRAECDPENRWKWFGQADRWHSLGKREAAWRFQRMPQQMYAGAMAMGPYTVSGDSRPKQQG